MAQFLLSQRRAYLSAHLHYQPLRGTRSTCFISLWCIEIVRPSSQAMTMPPHPLLLTVPRSVALESQPTRSPAFKSRDCSPVIGSICRSQTPHCELYLPVRQLSPMLHHRHVAVLWKLLENFASLEASRIDRQPKCLARKCTIRLAPFGHALGDIVWSIGHRLTPTRRHDPIWGWSNEFLRSRLRFPRYPQFEGT